MTILEKIKFEEDWLSEVNLTKENVKIAFDGIRATALEQQQQPCEDAISRQAVIRLVEQYPNIIGNRCSGLIADIKHLPSVTPKGECKGAYSEGYNEGYEDAKELYS